MLSFILMIQVQISWAMLSSNGCGFTLMVEGWANADALAKQKINAAVNLIFISIK